MKIAINVFKEPGADPVLREILRGTAIEELLGEYRSHLPSRVITARVDGEDVPLTYVLKKACDLTFCDIRDNSANRTFQRGLVLLYLKAVRDLFGEGARVRIHNSVNRGVFTTIEFDKAFPDDRAATEEDLRRLEKYMWELVDANLPIKVGKAGPKSRKTMSLCELDGYADHFYGLMPPRTGYITPFALELTHGGVLLRFPHPSDPARLSVYSRDAKIFDAYDEERRVLDAFGLSYVSDLNRRIGAGGAQDMIRLAEDRHAARIEELAAKIASSGKRVVLIAGPSSSGKTTFSKRLIEAISALGMPAPLYLGTDDYFVDREFAPRDKKGDFDFEGLDAMDVELFVQNINALLSGRKAELPRYDFIEGKKVFGERKEKLAKGQAVVVEGIHALNKKMTVGIPNDEKFKIYISPLTQLDIDGHNRIPSTDVRLIRRIVRDSRTRGHAAAATIKLWPKVRLGESVNIFPYNNEADEIFNSTLIYELPVLKKYAQPLLEQIEPDELSNGSGHIKWLLYLFGFFTEISDADESRIPADSILREFIGGSRFG